MASRFFMLVFLRKKENFIDKSYCFLKNIKWSDIRRNKMKKLMCLLIAVLLFLTSCSNSKPMPVLKSGVYKAAASDAYIEVFDDNTLMITGFDLTDLELVCIRMLLKIKLHFSVFSRHDVAFF